MCTFLAAQYQVLQFPFFIMCIYILATPVYFRMLLLTAKENLYICTGIKSNMCVCVRVPPLGPYTPNCGMTPLSFSKL